MTVHIEFSKLDPDVVPHDLLGSIEESHWREVCHLLIQEHSTGISVGLSFAGLFSVLLFPFGLLCCLTTSVVSSKYMKKFGAAISLEYNRNVYGGKEVFLFRDNCLVVNTEMAVAYAEECAQPDVELHINEEESNTGPGIESRVFRQPYVGDAG